MDRRRWRPIFFAAIAGAVSVGLTIGACSSDSSAESTALPSVTLAETTTPSTVVSTTTSVAFDLAVDIVAPAPLSIHVATIDLGGGRLAAEVRLEARVAPEAGDEITIVWSSNIDGPLGTGAALDAQLSNDQSDVVSHQITARATTSAGGRGSATIEVIVQVPSN